MSGTLGHMGRLADQFVMCGNVPITREKVRCLRPLPWLNSEVIDAYLGMLSMDPSRSSARTMVMNSRLFTLLTPPHSTVVHPQNRHYFPVNVW